MESTAPAAGADGVDPSAAVAATFNQDVDASTLSLSTFFVTGAVAASVSYDAATRTATLAPGAPLPAGTAVVVQLTEEVRALDGRALTGGFSWSFSTTRKPPPAVVATAPAGDEVTRTRPQVITATFSAPIDPSSVTSSSFVVEGVVGSAAYDASSLTATFTPSSPLTYGASYTATVQGVRDLAGSVMAAPHTWSFTVGSDGEVPVVVARSPAPDSSNIPLDTLVTATFSKPMNASTITSSSFTVSGATGVVTYDAPSRTASFTPQAPFGYLQTVTVTLAGSVADLVGNTLGAPVTWTFQTRADTDRPTVTARRPVPNASGVGLSPVVTATFSEPMNASTLTGASFTVSGATGVVTYDGPSRTASFTPQAPFGYLQTVTVTLAGSVADLAGNTLGAPVTWTFWTRADTDPPLVTARVPAPNEIDVGWSVKPKVTFNEALNPATVTAANLRLVPDTTPASTVSYDPASYTITLTPGAPLAELATYSIDLSSGVRDVAGNAVAAASWTFTTVKETTPPTVLSTVPTDGATSVSRTAPVTFTFDDLLLTSTVTPANFLIRTCTRWVFPPIGNIPFCSSWATVATTPSYDAATQTVTVAHALLAYDTAYQACAKAAVADDRGNLMGTDHCVDFTTLPDTVPPTIVSASLTDGERFVARDATPEVCFSEEIDTRTLTSFTFALPGILSTITWNAATLCARLQPSSLLFAATNLQLLVTAGVKDLAGNALANPLSLNFRTLGTTTGFSGAGEPYARAPNVVFNTSGEGIAVWVADVGEAAAVHAARFNGTAWEPETVLARYVNIGSLALGRPQLVSNGTTFAALWDIPGGGLAASVYSSGSWSAPVPLDTEGAGGSLLSSGGTYLAVWEVASKALKASRYSGGAWGAAQLLGSAPTHWAAASGGAGYAVVTAHGGWLYTHVGDGASWSLDPLDVANGFYASVAVAAGATHFVVAYIEDTLEGIPGSRTLYGQRFEAGAHDAAVNLGEPWRWAAPAIASNGGQRFCVAWVKQFAAQDRRVVAALYDGGWGSLEELTGAANILPETLKVSSDGSYFASAWSTNLQISAAARSSTGWSTPVVSSGLGWALEGSTGGYALVYARGADDMVARTYSGAWSPEVVLQTGPVGSPMLAPRGAGFGGVWEADGQITAAIRTSSWSVRPQLRQGTYQTSASEPKLARSGIRAVLIWKQFHRGTYRLYASFSSNNDSWSSPVLLDSKVTEASVAADGNYFAVLYSTESLDPAGRRIRAVAAPASTGIWGAPVQLVATTLPLKVPQVASTGSGFLATWAVQDSPTGTIYSSPSANGSAWSTPAAIGDGLDHQLTASSTQYFLTSARTEFGVGHFDWRVYLGPGWSAAQSIGLMDSGDWFTSAAAGTGMMVVWDGRTYWPPRSREYDGTAFLPMVATPFHPAPLLVHGDGAYRAFWSRNSSVLHRSSYDGTAWSASESFATPVSGFDVAGGPSEVALVLLERDPTDVRPRGYTFLPPQVLPGSYLSAQALSGGVVVVRGATGRPDFHVAWTGGNPTTGVMELRAMNGL